MSGPWTPLSQRTFRALWLANLVSDIGTAMHAVGAGWLMTQLAPSPFIVALVQAASTLPMFLLLLPAGALGDILDRRRLLIFALCWSVLAALLLGFATVAGWITPALLIWFTLALGIGAALAVPSFQAVVPELVPRDLLPAAVSLSSMGVNIARAAGPALAGLLIASFGVASVFVFNAASTVFTILVLWRWKRAAGAAALPPESFWSALRIGARYALHNSPLLAVLVRSAAFYTFAVALWALLPLVGAQLGEGATGYAILLSCLGAGAVIGALTLPTIRPKMSSERLSALATLIFAAAIAAAALVGDFRIVAAFMVAGGWAWLANLTTFNITARFNIADWVMSRGLAINQMVFFGGMTIGSIVWGQVASLASIQIALIAASVGMVAALAASARLPLASPDKSDLKPSLHWADPAVALQEANPDSRVLTTIEYEIEPANAAEFLAALQELRVSRLRNGGYGWGVYQDLQAPGRYVEQFLTSSWVEHLRQHQRTTLGDKSLQDRVLGFHRGVQPPRVTHLAAP